MSVPALLGMNKGSIFSFVKSFLKPFGTLLFKNFKTQLTPYMKRIIANFYQAVFPTLAIPTLIGGNRPICDQIETLRMIIGDKTCGISFKRAISVSSQLKDLQQKLMHTSLTIAPDYNNAMSNAIKMAYFLLPDDVSSDEEIDVLLRDLDLCINKYRLSKDRRERNAGLLLAEKIAINGGMASSRKIASCLRNLQCEAKKRLLSLDDPSASMSEAEMAGTARAGAMVHSYTETELIVHENMLATLLEESAKLEVALQKAQSELDMQSVLQQMSLAQYNARHSKHKK